MTGSEDVNNLRLTVAIYSFIFVLKIAVYSVSGVLALYAEALHTLTDVLIAGFLLLAAWWSRKEADESHMFGHDRAQNVAALVAATLFISFTSYKLFEEAIPHLTGLHPATYQNIPLVLAVLVVSMIAAAAPLLKLVTQKQRGAAAHAQLIELINDELCVLAAFLGTLGILWGHPIADPLATMVVATIIAINAFSLFRENSSYLLGRAPTPDELARIRKIAYSVTGVVDVHRVQAEYIGPGRIYATLHIAVRRGLAIEEADRIAEEVDVKVHDEFRDSYCVVRVEPEKATVPGPPLPQAG
jgi:cation diffusion facilitator family transporter